MPFVLRRWISFAKVGMAVAVAMLFSATTFIIHQKSDKIHGADEFAQHTRAQHQKHFISGMHAPFLTQDRQALELFNQHFGELSHLLATNIETLEKQQALVTSVKIRPLTECPAQLSPSTLVLAIGGPPALISSTAYLDAASKVVYMNNEEGRPIAYGSSFHLEEDADQQAPTSYMPIRFMSHQIWRALVKRTSYERIEKTGYYPWRTLDWVGYLKSPRQWLPALKIFVAIQLETMQDQKLLKEEELKTVAVQCVRNEKFFDTLDKKLEGKLLLPGTGSIMVARDQEELDDLYVQKKNLEKEGRTLALISRENIIRQLGFAPKGIAFFDKKHDRVLSPRYQTLLSTYIKQKGGTIINGTLKTVYTDGQKAGGIAYYQTPDGQDHYLAFGQLLMSLGNQIVSGFNDKPFFDTITATGSSVLALVYTPVDYQLPPVAVFGGTNNVTALSKPVKVMQAGQLKNLHLVRLTAGAAITPAYRGSESAYYEGTVGVGLLSAVRNTLGEACTVQPLLLYGCNRVLSKQGQSMWIEPYPGIHIQYGAAGGGLTRAPDLVAGAG